MVIIDASEEDIKEITRIYNQNLGTASMYLTPRDPEFFLDIIQNLGSNERLLKLADNDNLLGWSLIQKYSSKEGYRFVCETSTYIDHQYHGKGYGTHLKKEVINRCKELGFKYILARVVSANEVSIKYNLNLGYSIVGIQKRIGNVNGEWVDVTIMEYHIQ